MATAPTSIAYTPHGACWQLFHCQSPEVLISGPAGTGKSRAALAKVHAIAELVPGIRALLLRKTRASLTESALVTWEQHVLPEAHPCLDGPRRANRSMYRYPNGSEIILGGMDKPTRIMSTEYDLVYVQEAIELVEDEWEAITTRLRNSVLPYQQLLADTNPDRPTHWLKKRCEAGKTIMLESRHEDNPTLWDGKEWTPNGVKYLSVLDSLTGPRKARLRFGRWVQAEGVVYDGWDAAIHIIDPFDIPHTWPRVLSVDFGYTNPFVCQWWAIDPDGKAYRYREIYHTKRLVEDHAKQIVEYCWGEPEPIAIISDHDAEDRATLERHLGFGITPALAVKDKSPGIQAVAARLRLHGNGKPRIYFFRDSLVERDQDLAAVKKPCCTEEEFDGYCWRLKSTNQRKGEEPIDENNHGMDATRYLVATMDLSTDVEAGESVTVLVG